MRPELVEPRCLCLGWGDDAATACPGLAYLCLIPESIGQSLETFPIHRAAINIPRTDKVARLPSALA